MKTRVRALVTAAVIAVGVVLAIVMAALKLPVPNEVQGARDVAVHCHETVAGLAAMLLIVLFSGRRCSTPIWLSAGGLGLRIIGTIWSMAAPGQGEWICCVGGLILGAGLLTQASLELARTFRRWRRGTTKPPNVTSSPAP